MRRPQLLSTAYGTEAEILNVQAEYGNNPCHLMTLPPFRRALQLILQRQLSAGVDVLTTNTYTARQELYKPGGVSVFRELLKAHSSLVREQGGRHLPLWVSLGPVSDPYSPQGVDWQTAREVHELQLQTALALGDTEVALFETQGFGDEIVSIADLGGRRGLSHRMILSLRPVEEGKLPSGEDLLLVLRTALQLAPELRYGFNCCTFSALDFALRTIRGWEIPFPHVIYPNAASGDIENLDGSLACHGPENLQNSAVEVQRLARTYQIPVISGCCGYRSNFLSALQEISS